MGFVKTYEEILEHNKEHADFYDAEMLTLVWETESGVIEKLLPPPLQPASKPAVVAFLANYPSTNFSPGYLESALLVSASFDGQEGFYCLSMPVTNDMGMAGGRERFGYPKKMANIAFQREGNTVVGWTERHGIRFMQVKGNLTGKINDNSAMDEILRFGVNPDGQYSYFGFTFKHSPSPVAGESFDYPPRLVQGETVFRPRIFTFAEVEIEVTPSEFDPWHEVPVKHMLGGFYSIGDNSMLRGKIVAEVDPIEFAPYAFLKWEWATS